LKAPLGTFDSCPYWLLPQQTIESSNLIAQLARYAALTDFTATDGAPATYPG